ncbi:RNA-binding domain-containing protein [Bacteroides sp. 51]|uniref:RNA-binding domain-containing protein n=1 Tax=Bacteroides sp. 51 TaxID=2302938 RepID=UPI0013D29243|nr:RNA-binding domain-containing protein [Bacteroides sp. 51]NDV84858.1 AAA family ATPase [Bacteroides sp. 51]
MDINHIKSLIKQKESIRLEFKEAKRAVPKSMWDSVCSMLNREGGDIILGVDDNNNITGVDETQVNKLIKNIADLSNDHTNINPPFLLFPDKGQIDGKWVIHIPIPESSMVHTFRNIHYDRSDEGDFPVPAYDINKLYARKLGYFTENKVFPALKYEHFDPAIFDKTRGYIRSMNPDHIWLGLDNEALLRNAGFFKRDFNTGIEGYTLAAALVFGTDETIRGVIPHYEIDAIVKISGEEDQRFDDRIIIQTNLLDAYEKLMSFVEKHLPDKFHLEGDQRISLRTKIFREIVANLIVHREYASHAIATFIIYKDRVETSNASNPFQQGPLDLNSPYHHPKNPLISNFFMALGFVEKLGSGAFYVSKYIKQYSGVDKALFIEGSVFKMIIPRPLAQNVIISDSKNVQTGTEAGVQTGVEAGVQTDTEADVQTGVEAGVQTDTEADVQTGTEAGVQTGTEIDAHRSTEAGDKPSIAFFLFTRKEKQDNTNPTKNYQWMIFRGKVVKTVENAYKSASVKNKNISIPSPKNTGKVADLLEFIGMKGSVTREEIYEFLDYNSKSPVDRIIYVLTKQKLIDNPGGSRNKTYSLKGEIKELIEKYYK